MSQFRQHEIPTSYAAAEEVVEASNSGVYVAAPPPMGYPVRDGAQYPHQTVMPETQSKGDGFWKGCCAALCCCWVLDCIF